MNDDEVEIEYERANDDYDKNAAHKRREEAVEQLAIMIQGGMWVSLQRFVDALLTEARVEQMGDELATHPYTDIVLRDGWRIRLTRSVVPPEGLET